MKHLKLIVVIFTLLLTLPANAEDYIVKASRLTFVPAQVLTVKLSES